MAKVVSFNPITEPSGQSFLSDRYDTAIFCFSKGLPFSSTVPGVPAIPFIPAKEAKNRPTLSMRWISSYTALSWGVDNIF